VEVGQAEKAMEMFSDLRLFNAAKALAAGNELVLDVIGKTSVQEIIEKQAEWTADTQDHEAAADTYIAAGQLDKALVLLTEHGPASKLIEVQHFFLIEIPHFC
jgi:intraflagellar transport protein 122